MAHDLVDLDISYTYDHKFSASVDDVYEAYIACKPPIGVLKKLVVVSKGGPWGYKETPLIPELFQEGARLRAIYGFLFCLFKREMLFDISAVTKHENGAEVIMSVPDQRYSGYERFGTRCYGESKVTIEKHTEKQCLLRSSVILHLKDFPEYYTRSFSQESEKLADKQFRHFVKKLEKMLR